MSSNPGQATPPQPQSSPTPTALLGGTPTPTLDIPLSTSLLIQFAFCFALHAFYYVRNRRRDHKFLFSAAVAAFCLARLAALAVRIVWATDNANRDLTIVAGVLTNAGVLILFLVNLVLVQRVLRGLHPDLGWSVPVGVGFKLLLASVVGVLAMVVVCSVHSAVPGAADAEARRKERVVLLVAGCYMAALAFVPAVVAGVAYRVMNQGGSPPEEFGKGGLGSKVVVVVATSVLLTIGAGFRAGVNFATRPVNDPGWWHSKPAYYAFNFGIELVVVWAWGLLRFDRRFYVPDGSSGPGDYSKADSGEALNGYYEAEVQAPIQEVEARFPPDSGHGHGHGHDEPPNQASGHVPAPQPVQGLLPYHHTLSGPAIKEEADEYEIHVPRGNGHAMPPRRRYTRY